MESLFIVTFFLLADLSNRIHLLLLISIVSCYTIVVLGLVALGAHFNRGVVHQFEILTNYAVQYA